MRICQITPKYLPGKLGGSGKYIQSLAEGLTKRGHSVFVHTANALEGEALHNPFSKKRCSKNFENINGVQVFRYKCYPLLCSAAFLLARVLDRFMPKRLIQEIEVFANGPLILGLTSGVRSCDCDLIHTSPFPLTNVWLAWRAAQKLNLPFVCTPFFHFDIPGQESKFFRSYYNKHFKEILTKADALIACTKLEKKALIAQGADSAKVHVISMGVHPEQWKKTSGKRFRDKYRLGKKKIILFAGSKGYNKGAVHLLRAIEKVQKLRKDVVLVAIGLSTKEWEEAKKKNPEVEMIDFGYKDGQEKFDIFAACDLFVMPSRSDAFGIVFLEAWLCEKPVIGAQAGGLPEVIRDGKDGYLVKFGDVDALAQKINFLLDNPKLRRRFGREGKKKTLANFTWERVIKDTEKIFKSIVS